MTEIWNKFHQNNIQIFQKQNTATWINWNNIFFRTLTGKKFKKTLKYVYILQFKGIYLIRKLRFYKYSKIIEFLAISLKG